MQLQALPFVGLFSVIWLIALAALLRILSRVLRWGLVPRDDEESIFHGLAFLALILVTALAVLWTTPYQASNLGISDSVEYSVAAERLLNQGSYSLSIGGQELPPRYAPWFSTLFIAPAMIFTSTNLGNAIWPVLIFSMLGIAIAFCVGRKLSGTWGGILASFALLLDPGYRYFSKFPMTDIPAAVLTLLVLTYCLILKTQKEPRENSFLSVGVLCALLAGLRMTSSLIVLPAVWTAYSVGAAKGRTKRIACILAPLAVMLAVQAIYQTVTFGSPLRNGYEFWVPWPYEFFSKVFSARYVLANAPTLLLHTPALMFCVLFLSGWPVLREKKEGVRLDREAFFALLKLVVFFGAPLALLYLVYFYSTSRFFLPISVPLYALLGAFIGAFLGAIERHRVGALICLLVLAAGVAGWRSSAPIERPARRVAADSMARNTSVDAVIITAIDPVYLEPLVLRNTKRSILPISRRIEFASKVVAWSALSYSEPYPADIAAMPREYLLQAGAKDVVENVALDGGDSVAKALEVGRPVYVETSALEPAELKTFTERFIMQEVGKDLFLVTRVWSATS